MLILFLHLYLGEMLILVKSSSIEQFFILFKLFLETSDFIE